MRRSPCRMESNAVLHRATRWRFPFKLLRERHDRRNTEYQPVIEYLPQNMFGFKRLLAEKVCFILERLAEIARDHKSLLHITRCKPKRRSERIEGLNGLIVKQGTMIAQNVRVCFLVTSPFLKNVKQYTGYLESHSICYTCTTVKQCTYIYICFLSKKSDNKIINKLDIKTLLNEPKAGRLLSSSYFL